MKYTYDFPRPGVTVDTVVFDMYDEDKIPKVLLIKRKHEPFKGMWAIPGGFLEMDEELEVGAARELYEETGLDIPPGQLQQIVTVGRRNRDPRDRIISIVYTVVVDRFEHTDICAGDDAEDARWFKVTELPTLAADHLEIVRQALGMVV
jgi:ADP-ribose pyrophosphatase YjhB (NUDIX family)